MAFTVCLAFLVRPALGGSMITVSPLEREGCIADAERLKNFTFLMPLIYAFFMA